MTRFHKAMGIVLTAAMVLAGCSSAKQPATPPATSDPTPSAEAKAWAPEKAVTMVVPYSAGGSTDVLARVVEKVWPKYVDQPLTVVNQPGASGWVGRDAVAKAKPDGYTLMMGYGSGEDLIAPQLRQATFDPINDFVAVSLLSNHALLYTVPADSPYKTMEEMMADAKNGEVTAALSGVGNLMDISVRSLAKAAGVEITGVPFAGGGPATTAMVGGQVSFGPGHPSELMPHVKGERLRVLAVASPEREALLPDVPTLKELGIDFVNAGSLKGVAAPAGTPDEIVSYYEDVFKKIAEDPEFKKAMDDAFQPVKYLNSEDFGDMIKEYYDTYGKLIKDLGITVE